MRSGFAFIFAATNFARRSSFTSSLASCRTSPVQSNFRRAAARSISMSGSSEFQQPKISTRIQATDDPCIVMMQVTIYRNLIYHSFDSSTLTRPLQRMMRGKEGILSLAQVPTPAHPHGHPTISHPDTPRTRIPTHPALAPTALTTRSHCTP